MARYRPLLLAACATIAFAAAALVWQLWPAGVAPDIEAAQAAFDPACNPAKATVPPALAADRRLELELGAARAEAERLQALDHFAAAKDARSDCAALRAVQVAGASPVVRVRAFEVATALALAEDRDALIAVLNDGLNNPYGEVRRAGLRACREHPHFELMDDLLAIVARADADRPVAIAALAFLDDPQAQAAVLQTAQSEDLPRAQRIQAIALLSRSDLGDAVTYLKTLATGDDAELAAFAMEALAARQGE